MRRTRRHHGRSGAAVEPSSQEHTEVRTVRFAPTVRTAAELIGATTTGEAHSGR